MTVKHAFVDLIPDVPADVLAGKVVPTNWNADHVITTLQVPTTGTNVMTLAGGTAGNPVTLTASGSDTDIAIRLSPKGAHGFVQLGPDTLGVAGWPTFSTAVEILTLTAPTARSFGAWIKHQASDLGGVSTAVALNAFCSTQSTASNNVTSLQGLYSEGRCSLPAGRTLTALLGVNCQAYATGGGSVGSATGFAAQVLADTGSDITVGYGVSSYVYDLSPNSGTRIGYAYYANFANSVPMAEAYSFWTNELGGLATNAYSFWHDEQGVFRIKADNTFDSVYQAIPALYNPQITKYVPGAANFERGVMGQWTGNVWQITTEKGGTGTLRGMQLGASTTVPLGFYGKTPIACAVLATGAGHSVDDVITALQNLGLVKQS